MRVVFSIDFIMTLFFGVIGELASFKGLKPSTTFVILFDVPGRVRIRMDKRFKVASTKIASLLWQEYVNKPSRQGTGTGDLLYLLLSCKTPSILSRSPVASASNSRGSKTG